MLAFYGVFSGHSPPGYIPLSFLCPFLNFNKTTIMRTKKQTCSKAYHACRWLQPAATLLLLMLSLVISTIGIAQVTPTDCVQGCTSNDVQIKNAYLSDASGNKLSSSFVCPVSGTATVYLTLELTTNTPRIGVAIFTRIKRFDPATQTVGAEVSGSPISQCFGIALNQPTNKVTFLQSFTWTCGTPIVMTDVFIAWGTGNTNFCTGTPFQCPATPSKCYQLPGGSFIAIETPVPQNQTVTQCSDAKGGTTSTFNLNNISVTTSANVTVTWWQNFTAPGTFSNQITTTSAYVSPTRTIYAKITSNSNSSVFSVSTVNLVVNQTPNLVITNPTAVCSPATVDITAATVTTGSTLPSGTTLTYYFNNNGSPGTQITSSAAQSLGSGTYWIKATTNTTPACSDQKQVVVTVNQTPAAPVLSKVDNCNGTTTITAKDANSNNISSSELTWSNGATGNPITVSNTTAVTATRTVNGCPSSASNSITSAPKTTPAAPVLSKVDNCNGTTTITAKDAGNNNISSSELTWSNGATGNPITANTTTAVTATRTVNGCTSGNSNSITPAPKNTPSAPVLSKVDNCDGTTVITAKDAGNTIINASELTWSNGATTNPITVTTTTPVTATRTVNGCTSVSSNSVTPAPGNAPAAPSVTYNPPVCDQTTFSVTITNVVAGVTYTIKDKNGATITGVSPGNSVTAPNANNISFSNIPAGSGYQVTASVGSCSSAASNCNTSAGITRKVVDNTNLVLADGNQLQVKAFPNPFNDKVKFVVNSAQAGNGSLEIYNMLGQKIKTVYQGHINSGNQNFELTIPKKQQSALIYILRVGDKHVNGKLLQLNN
jgi:hypothetical protein